MEMKLSNTLMMNASLMPKCKKAFTLAEVLITLTILGVVAALTIPSLVNRQSEVAAKAKMRKALANYENVAAVYMAENEATDCSGMVDDGLSNYFKIANEIGDNDFVTSDGVRWTFNDDGSAVLCDSADDEPFYCVNVWAAGGRVNDSGADYLPDDGAMAAPDRAKGDGNFATPAAMLSSAAFDPNHQAAQ